MVDFSKEFKQWEEICIDNDQMANFIYKKYTTTDSTGKPLDQKEYRVNKDDFLMEYQNFYKLDKISFNNILNDAKRCGLIYDRQATSIMQFGLKEEEKENKKIREMKYI